MALLAENNICGQTLLHIVSRGSSIIAELLRLVEHIPSVLSAEAPDDRRAELARYAPILFDLSYLRSPERYDKLINTSLELGEADDEWYSMHAEVLERFSMLFQSMHLYISDYHKFLKDLDDGFYIQHTLEGVLLDVEGRQLMCEALFLQGVMLLLFDQKLPGPVRERLLIAHYRHKGESPGVPIVELVKLTRDSGYRHGSSKRPANYPEEYLSRFPPPERVVQLLIGRLRSDDVYQSTRIYPAPEQRCSALASQASLLYVILYFSPRTLHEAKPAMREIVDKHYGDNWVVPVYMGWSADLTVEWERYKAAREALAMDAVTPKHVTQLLLQHRKALVEVSKGLDQALTEGVLTESYVIDNTSSLLDLVRQANIALRWVFLHRRSESKQWRDMVHDAKVGFPDGGRKPLVDILLRTALLEYKLKSHLKHVLAIRAGKWDEDRSAAAAMLGELSSYYSGSAALTRVERDEGLHAWFATLQAEVQGLQPGDGVLAGRKIRQLLRALDEVQSFDTIDTSANVKEFLSLIKTHLTDMVRIANITDTVLADLNSLSDFSYAWQLVQEEFVGDLHDRIRADAGAVRSMRALFLKLTSVLDVPLVRITQAGGRDALSVAEYYSGELVAFLRTVLSVIPAIVFGILKDIIQLQARDMKPLPVKIEAAALRDYAQLDQRAELARRTHEISVFTEGVLAMEKTLLGVIQVDPRAILNDGIRRHLADQIHRGLHLCLAFDTASLSQAKPGKGKDPRALLETPLDNLRVVLASMKDSFEYAQDYVGVYGLKTWQEELTRVLRFNGQQEANRFVAAKKRVTPAASAFQSKVAPLSVISKTPAGDTCPAHVLTFMGRLLECLLAVTQPSRAMYGPGPTGGAWYDHTGREIVGKGTFNLMASAIGVPGLTALDTLLGHVVETALGRFLRGYAAELKAGASGILDKLGVELQPLTAVSTGVLKSYAVLGKSLSKRLETAVEALVTVGHAQLLRRAVATQLRFLAKLDANALSVACEALDNAMLGDIRRHFASGGEAPLPTDNNPLLASVARQTEAVGLAEPLAGVYTSVEPALQPTLGLWLALALVSNQPRLAYDREMGNLVSRKAGDPLDGGPLVAGLVTVLKQVHPAVTDDLLAFGGQYIRSCVHVHIGGTVTAASGGDAVKLKELRAQPSLPPEAVGMVLLILQTARTAHVPDRALHAHVPAHLFDLLQPAPGAMAAP